MLKRHRRQTVATVVDKSALKTGLLIGGGALVLLLGSLLVERTITYLSFLLARTLSTAILIGLAVAAGYVGYELYSGWNEAGEGVAAETSSDTETRTVSGPEDLEDLYAEGELSERELERELEYALDREASESGSESDSELELKYE